MNDLLPYLSVTLAAILLVMLFWRRGELEGSGVESMAATLPSSEVIHRVFSQEDLRYAQSLPKPVYRLFARERRSMAMTWIRQVRYTGVGLMRSHVHAVRRASSLHLWTEARIAASFIAILASCEVVALAVVTLGPGRLQAVISFLVVRIHALHAQLENSCASPLHQTA